MDKIAKELKMLRVHLESPGAQNRVQVFFSKEDHTEMLGLLDSALARLQQYQIREAQEQTLPDYIEDTDMLRRQLEGL